MTKFSSLLALALACGCNRFKDPSDAGNFDPDHVLTVEISVTTEQWDFLRNQTRSFFSEFMHNFSQIRVQQRLFGK